MSSPLHITYVVLPYSAFVLSYLDLSHRGTLIHQSSEIEFSKLEMSFFARRAVSLKSPCEGRLSNTLRNDSDLVHLPPPFPRAQRWFYYKKVEEWWTEGVWSTQIQLKVNLPKDNVINSKQSVYLFQLYETPNDIQNILFENIAPQKDPHMNPLRARVAQVQPSCGYSICGTAAAVSFPPARRGPHKYSVEN